MKLNQIHVCSYATYSQSIEESKHFFDAEIKLHVNITLFINLMNTSCHYMVKKLDQQSCAKFDTFDIKGGGADEQLKLKPAQNKFT